MRSRAVVVASVLAGTLVSGGWLMQRGFGPAGGGGSVQERARLFDEVMTHVSRFYVDTLPEAVLYQKAVDGVLQELRDPHSVFLTRDRLDKLKESTTGRYAGIGVQVDVRDGAIVVLAPLPNTPAQRAGVQTGDRIVTIAGKPTAKWTTDEALKALRGAPGSKVAFVVERPGVEEPMTFSVSRQEIQFHSVRHALLLQDGVGLVDLTTFSEDAADELRRSIDSLRRAGMTGLVLDLRSNPGGLLDQGVAVSDLFLAPGQKIVGMKGRSPEANREYTDNAPAAFPGLPVVVLIDSGSASASEIVAGALQDHDRAAVVGTTSYGKGSAQSLYPMATGGALKLTTALWYTPSGRSINRPREDGEEDEDGEPADTTRPRFKTTAGRTVLGGGGIIPDVEVGDRALDSAETAFQRALGKQIPQFRDALTAYALQAKAKRAVASPDFPVTPEMRAELYAQMRARGVEIDRPTYDAAAPLVSRLLAYQIAQYVFGNAAEFARSARDDAQIRTAVELLRGAKTPREVIDRAEARGRKK